MKHAMGWRVKQLPHGLIEWTDPSGRTYVDVPPRVARFVPTDELPPGAPMPRVQRDLGVWTGDGVDAWGSPLEPGGFGGGEVDDWDKPDHMPF